VSYFIDPNPNKFGSSFHGALFRCTQSAKYQQTLPSQQKWAYVRGSLVHIGLAHHLAQRSTASGIPVHHDDKKFTAPTDVLDPNKAIELAAESRNHYEFVDLSKQAVQVFKQEYYDDNLRAHAVEHTMGITYDDYLVQLRVDWIGEDTKTGLFWMIDNKTSSYMKKDTLEAFSLDFQFLFLHHLGRHYYGDRFGGVKVQVLNLGKKVEVYRANVGFAPAALRQLPDMIRYKRKEWDALQAANTSLDSYPKAFHNLVCRHSYGMCDYFERCKMGSPN
jgi:hypothetical protein